MYVSLSHLAGSFFNAAVAYMILAMQLHMGFPPFYRSLRPLLSGDMGPGKEEMIKRIIPFAAGLAVASLLFIATELEFFQLAAGFIAAACGLLLRRDMFVLTGGTLPWLTHPATVRWPMLVFDAWTLGIALAFGLMILA